MSSCVCTHCKITLEIPEEFNNSEIECPNCHNMLLVEIPNMPIPSTHEQLEKNVYSHAGGEEKSVIERADSELNNENEARIKQHYLWGYYYIKISNFLAFTVIVALIVQIVITVNENIRQRDKRYEKILIQAKSIMGKQVKFEDLYLQTMSVFNKAESNTGANENIITGFSLPKNILSPAVKFNNQLATSEDVEQSLFAAQQYEDMLKAFCDCVKNELNSNLNEVTRFLNRYKRTHGAAQEITLVKGELRNFYMSEAKVKASIRKIDVILNSKSLNDFRMKKDILKIKSYMNFIARNLLSNLAFDYIGKGGDNDNQRKYADLELLNSTIKNIMAAFYEIDNMKIYTDWEALVKELGQLHIQTLEHENKTEQEFRKMLIDICSSTLLFLFYAFMILILADYLRAHFYKSIK